MSVTPSKKKAVLTAMSLVLLGAAPGARSAEDFTTLSLSDLMNVDITSVSMREEKLSDAAAAVYVLSNEQLLQSGARNIAEALRMVPGVQVARTDARTYAVSVRGFNSTSADKLEVRLDGRSVYTPLFSGVFWDVLETDLTDIERIEVIRGPGASLYGANAVNGVINITSKSAAATAGGHLQLAGGNEERAMLRAAQSLKIGDTALRVNALGNWRDDSRREAAGPPQDGARFSQASVRSDSKAVFGGSFSSSLNAYDARFQAAAGDTTARGQSLQGSWRAPASYGDRSLSASYEHYERVIPGTYSERRNNAAIDYQEQRSIGDLHQLVYGAGLHYSQDETGGPPIPLIFSPANRTLNTFSAFLQDQIRLTPATTLTLGSKFERNDVSGFEAQPSIRLGWRLRPEAFVWSAISRAVRTPNRLDQDVAIYCPPPNGFPGFCGPGNFRIGNPELKSETLIAYESGLRLALSRSLSADLAVFHNEYQRLKSTEPTPPFGEYRNGLKAHSDGGELLMHWQPGLHWQVEGNYSLLSLRAKPSQNSADRTTAASINGSSPRHQLGASLRWQPAPKWQLAGNARYLSRLPAQNISDRAELGLRIGYLLRPGLSLALAGENLLHDQEAEFGSNPATRSALQRSGWLSLNWDWQ